jgi:hypothetical protein
MNLPQIILRRHQNLRFGITLLRDGSHATTARYSTCLTNSPATSVSNTSSTKLTSTIIMRQQQSYSTTPPSLSSSSSSSSPFGESGGGKKLRRLKRFVPRKAAVQLTEQARIFFKRLLEANPEKAGVSLNYHQASSGEPRMVFSFSFALSEELSPEDEGCVRKYIGVLFIFYAILQKRLPCVMEFFIF